MQVALRSPLCGHFLRLPRARSSLIPIPRLLRLRPPALAQNIAMCTPPHPVCRPVVVCSLRVVVQPHHRFPAPPPPPPTPTAAIARHPRPPPPPSPSSPSQIDPRPTLRPGPRLGLAWQVERDDKSTTPPPAHHHPPRPHQRPRHHHPDTLLHDIPAPSPPHPRPTPARAPAAALAVALSPSIGRSSRLAQPQGQTVSTPSGIGCPQAQHIAAHT